MSPGSCAPGVQFGAIAGQEPANPTQIITTLADLLTTLPDSDRADIIAGLPQAQRVAVAKLLAARITEDTPND